MENKKVGASDRMQSLLLMAGEIRQADSCEAQVEERSYTLLPEKIRLAATFASETGLHPFLDTVGVTAAGILSV